MSESSAANQGVEMPTNITVTGGVLGAIIVILTVLLVLSLVGMLYMYNKMQTTEKTQMNRKRTLSR